jgi:tyrosyl-tRNA synthetase
LEKEVVQAFADRLLDQFSMILSKERLEIRYNAEWLESIDMDGILRLTSSYTVARMLEREDFANRYAAGRPISIMEFMYPLFQGYDSIAVEADVELGGSDQLFNLLVGRELQRSWGQTPQLVMTLPLLEGLDGVKKMSQSLGNYVGITDEPAEMFGKLMRIPDELIGKYLRLCTPLTSDEVAVIERDLAVGSVLPADQKRRMARSVVEVYNGEAAGTEAEDAFNRVHRDHSLPETIDDIPIPSEAADDEGVVWLPRLLVALGRAPSHSEARRMLQQGGVRLDSEPVTDPDFEAHRDEYLGRVLQVGRRWFGRLQ